jgi:hypothetical protein
MCDEQVNFDILAGRGGDPACLNREQLAALEQTKQHTDFNDVANRSALELQQEKPKRQRKVAKIG